MQPSSNSCLIHTKMTYRICDRSLRRGEWRIPIFWGLGLWGYITSYKGISTNFVLREPSVYQNICDCLSYNQEFQNQDFTVCHSVSDIFSISFPRHVHILTKHLQIVNTQYFIKRKAFFVIIYQQLRISMDF